MGIGMGYRSSSSFDKRKEPSESLLGRIGYTRDVETGEVIPHKRKEVSRSILGGRSSSTFDKPKSAVLGREPSGRKKLPNPDPSNYRILKHVQIGEYLLLELRYPDCTNYEGKKVLLFRSTYRELENQGVIDPHFSDNKEFISPIARFEPTSEGWRWGKELANKLSGEV